MAPLTPDRARAFWREMAQDVPAEKRVLLIAKDRQGICGTAQLVLSLPANQPYRADLVKMLVHRYAGGEANAA